MARKAKHLLLEMKEIVVHPFEKIPVKEIAEFLDQHDKDTVTIRLRATTTDKPEPRSVSEQEA